MKNNLLGKEGRSGLIESLQNFNLINGDQRLAERLFDAGEIVEFKSGDTLMAQGAKETEVYFILGGEADVLINDQRIAVRKSGESVGEMAMVDPSEPRTATVKAAGDVTALKISEEEFTRIANDHPHLWRSIAKAGFALLRQKSGNS
jgi:CRP-like cAMP-binding protein